jgi:hypothetical protein
LTQLRDYINIGGALGDDMMILVFDATLGLHYYWSLSLCYFRAWWLLVAVGLLSLVVYDHDTFGYYGTIEPGITPGGSWPALVGIQYV